MSGRSPDLKRELYLLFANFSIKREKMLVCRGPIRLAKKRCLLDPRMWRLFRALHQMQGDPLGASKLHDSS